MSVMVVIGRNFLGLAFLALVTAWVSEMRGGPVLVFPSSICLVTLRWWPCWASEPWSTPSGMPARDGRFGAMALRAGRWQGRAVTVGRK